MSEVSDIGLRVEGLGKVFESGGVHKRVFRDLNFTVPRNGRMAILGRNGQGKSTLIRMLGGIMPATEGRVKWSMASSWPIGFAGGFQGSLTGIDNIRFLSRIYQRDYQTTLDRVEDFAELGIALRRPVKHYSSGMRARLAFGLSLAIEFDCYLIDELIAVGDARFQEKCYRELFEHRRDRAFMMASHDMNIIASVCEKGLIIEGGQAKIFDDIEEAVDVYRWLHAA